MDSTRRVSNARRLVIAIVLSLATAAFTFLAVAPHVGGQQPTTPYAAIASDVPPQRLPPGGTANLRRAAEAVCADLRHGPGHYSVPGYPNVTLTVGGVFTNPPGFGVEGNGSQQELFALTSFSESAHRRLCPELHS